MTAKKQPTKVTFREEETVLLYPLYALEKLEDAGVDIAKFGDGDISMKELVRVVWAGLICKYPDATVEEVGMQFDVADIEQLGTAISEAFNKATGK